MLRLVKHDQRWTHGRKRTIGLACLHHPFQLWTKELAKGVRGVGQELKHVVGQFRCSSAEDDDVADAQDLQQQSVAHVVVLREAESTFGVEDERGVGVVESGPDAHGAGVGGGRSAKLFLSVEEELVEREGFAIAGIADDGDAFDRGVRLSRVQSFDKFVLIVDLQRLRC